MSALDALVDSLRAIDLFHDFDAAILTRIAKSAVPRAYSAGQTIFLADDPGDSMFVVVSGRVRLSIATASGRELSLRHVEAGSAFGEIALLDGRPRSADATAIRPTKLLTIPRTSFQGILDSNPAMAKALLIGLCARLRDTTAQLESIALTSLEQRL